MKPTNEIPHEALPLHYNSGGFQPEIFQLPQWLSLMRKASGLLALLQNNQG